MQRKIIFLATNDPVFEKAATEAILATRHGMRKTGNPWDVWGLLTREDEEVAVALIDVDFESCGLFLLHILAHSETGFPVLAATANPDAFLADKETPHSFIHYLKKPATAGGIRKKLLELCSEENLPATAMSRGTL